MIPTAISLIVIRAADMQASLAFYRALGIDLVQEQHGSGPVHYSCESGGLVLELYPDKPGTSADSPAHTTMLGFTVASLDNSLRALQDLGTLPKSPPQESEWGKWANVIDPDGRTIRLSEALN